MKYFLILFMCASFSVLGRPLKVSTFPFPPFMSEDGEGYLDQMVLGIFNTAQIEKKVTRYPYARYRSMLLQDSSQLFLGGTDSLSEEELDQFHVVEIMKYDLYLMTADANSALLKSEGEKAQFIIGTLRGRQYGEKLAKVGPVKTQGLSSSLQGMQMMANGRIDMVVCVPLSCADSLKGYKLDPRDYHLSERPISHGMSALLIPKSAPDAEDLYKTLLAARDSFFRQEKAKKLVELINRERRSFFYAIAQDR